MTEKVSVFGEGGAVNETKFGVGAVMVVLRYSYATDEVVTGLAWQLEKVFRIHAVDARAIQIFRFAVAINFNVVIGAFTHFVLRAISPAVIAIGLQRAFVVQTNVHFACFIGHGKADEGEHSDQHHFQFLIIQ